MSSSSRPTGVTIVGILYMILAIISLIGAIGFLFLTGASQSELVSKLPNAPIWLVEGGSLLLMFLGLIIFLVAVINFLISIGCFRGWGWVWSWALVFAILNIAISMFNAFSQGFTSDALWTGIVGAIIPIAVLGYLSTKKVRKFFGKA